MEGEINSSGFLVIGEGAIVKANIKADTVIISGTVQGNVEARERLEIHENGKLYGNIRTAKLKIADGVVFEGKCEMIKSYDKSGEAASPKPAAETAS
jgi:cytoskeletal protein CcmA (bactofilin family)